MISVVKIAMDDVNEALTAQQELERKALDNAFREVFALDSGKRVLFWMLEQCSIYSDAFSGENNATNYTLGLQAGGRKLIAKLDEVDPRFYPQLLLAIGEIKAMELAVKSAAQQENENDVDA